MITRLFLDRLRAPDPRERAHVVAPLFRAYLCEQLSAVTREEIGCGLAAVLDDPSPLVRKTLADALAEEPRAPHHMVMGLARDQLAVAARVIICSPVLRDYDLIELIAESDDQVREMIAVRLHLSATVAAVLADQAGAVPCVSLLQNPTAALTPLSIARIAERHANDPLVRSVMLDRADLPIPIRQGLTTALCDALGSHAMVKAYVRPERMERVMRETWERATIELACTAIDGERRTLIAHLGTSGKLTAGLLLRALTSGNFSFFEEALAYLARLPVLRASKLARDRSGIGFRALYERAGLPAAAFDGFEMVVQSVLDAQDAHSDLTSARVRRQLLQGALETYAPQAQGSADTVLKHLSRLHDEAAREEAKSVFFEDARAA